MQVAGLDSEIEIGLANNSTKVRRYEGTLSINVDRHLGSFTALRYQLIGQIYQGMSVHTSNLPSYHQSSLRSLTSKSLAACFPSARVNHCQCTPRPKTLHQQSAEISTSTHPKNDSKLLIRSSKQTERSSRLETKRQVTPPAVCSLTRTEAQADVSPFHTTYTPRGPRLQTRF